MINNTEWIKLRCPDLEGADGPGDQVSKQLENINAYSEHRGIQPVLRPFRRNQVTVPK